MSRSHSRLIETTAHVGGILSALPSGERYAVIGALCARFLLTPNIKSGSADFAEFVAMFGKSVDTVLVEMQLQKAAAMTASGTLPSCAL
jgi:hypothetical protein